ncbi:MAG: CcmD family protein [Bacteroidetes bacterium]|nr:CcmD family protein [Bacteroidota bacterium]
MEFFEQNQMYIVMLIVLVTWFGLLGFLIKLDRQVKKLEELLKK